MVLGCIECEEIPCLPTLPCCWQLLKMNHLYHELVVSGIDIVFVSFGQTCFGMLVFQQNIQSLISLFTPGADSESVWGWSSWTPSCFIEEPSMADCWQWYCRQCDLTLHFTLGLLTRHQRHKAVPTLSNNEVSGENTFFSASNLRKSNGNLLFRHLIHPRWKGGFNPAGTGPVCWAYWMSCTRCGIDSIYILCNVTGKESFKESNIM